jgi:hypothetical protein
VNLISAASLISGVIILFEAAIFYLTGLGFLIGGAISGALLACLNLAAIIYLVGRLTRSSSRKSKIILPLIFIGKLILVSAMIFFLIVECRVNPIGLAVGLTSVLISAASAALILLFRSAHKGSNDG